jgi:hypothetical protein
MRNLILFFLLTTIVIGGLYVLGFELLNATAIYIRFVIGAVMLVTFGAVVWWDIDPLLGVNDDDEVPTVRGQPDP